MEKRLAQLIGECERTIEEYRGQGIADKPLPSITAYLKDTQVELQKSSPNLESMAEKLDLISWLLTDAFPLRDTPLGGKLIRMIKELKAYIRFLDEEEA